ncbi:MAG: D-alanyl-D-alanine carboxypeptidase [Cyanobacteria bacterium P01_C01_bin.89]
MFVVGGWGIVATMLLGAGAVQSVAVGTGARLSWSGIERSPQQMKSETETSGADTVLARYFAQLQADGMDPANHGVWLQQGYRHLGSYNGSVPRSAASLTKVATSLAALDKWGVNHRFVTKFWTDGEIQGDRLVGNLIVEGGGDPFFVWEEAIAVGQALNQLGIREVTQDLVLTGQFNMNFLPDPQDPDRFPDNYAGELLKVAFDADKWTPPVEKFFKDASDTLDPVEPEVRIAGKVRLLPQVKPTEERATLLVERRSFPLVQLLKLMNLYSNNAMAEQLAEQLGGGPAIAQTLAESMDFPANEIQLINGSGLGVDNRISPRAATAMVFRLAHTLENPVDGTKSYTLADVFPVAGFDRATIKDRNMPVGSAVKTGTLNAVSALSGLFATETYGVTGFAIVNGGLPRILRINQDRLLQNLQGAWGKPGSIPTALTPQKNQQGRTHSDPKVGDRQRSIIPLLTSPKPSKTTVQ